MPKLSDFVVGSGNGLQASTAGSFSLVAKASRFVIAVNDLLYMTGKGDIYPAQSVSWASPISGAGGGNGGSALIAETTVSTPVTANVNDVRQACWVNPLDQSIFILAQGGSGTGSNSTVLNKYASSGALVASITVDSGGAANVGSHNLIQLSNGNLAAFWANGGGTQAFAIFDTDLNQVVAKTALAGPAIV